MFAEVCLGVKKDRTTQAHGQSEQSEVWGENQRTANEYQRNNSPKSNRILRNPRQLSKAGTSLLLQLERLQLAAIAELVGDGALELVTGQRERLELGALVGTTVSAAAKASSGLTFLEQPRHPMIA